MNNYMNIVAVISIVVIVLAITALCYKTNSLIESHYNKTINAIIEEKSPIKQKETIFTRSNDGNLFIISFDFYCEKIMDDLDKARISDMIRTLFANLTTEELIAKQYSYIEKMKALIENFMSDRVIFSHFEYHIENGNKLAEEVREAVRKYTSKITPEEYFKNKEKHDENITKEIERIYNKYRLKVESINIKTKGNNNNESNE